MIFNEKFKEFLVQKETIDSLSLEKALIKSNEAITPLFNELVKEKVASELTIYQYLAEYLNLKIHGFQLTEINFSLVKQFPREKLIEYQAAPYNEDETTINFAISNPFRIEDAMEFKMYTKKKLNFFLCLPSQMSKVVSYIDNKIQQTDVIDNYSTSDKDISDAAGEDNLSIDAPVIKLCDSILKDAVQRGASDIHIEPFDQEILLRFRIDGELTVIDRISINLYQSVLARFKIMSELNIAERRIPQDGKIKLEINNVEYDFRVSTLPTIHGEKIVIRIYNISYSTSNLDVLGFNDKQRNLVLDMLSKPHGIILLTGPTGSGKSTTLYTFLRYLNKENLNIITVEDPVENQIQGINQVQVNPKANFTFANALRSILRQDPNIIMIGEIRDEETAQIATRAAITGHLVLSTIHTNDATGVVIRLINMGIPKYLVADSLLGSISQRLVRKLCPVCKKAHITTEAEMKMLHINEPRRIYEPCGCRVCNNTGYSGRTGVFEMMVCNQTVKKEIMSDDFTSDKLNHSLKRHMSSLLDNAKELVLKGVTSIEEFEKLSEVIEQKRKV